MTYLQVHFNAYKINTLLENPLNPLGSPKIKKGTFDQSDLPNLFNEV